MRRRHELQRNAAVAANVFIVVWVLLRPKPCPMIEDERLLHAPDDFSHGGDTGGAWFQQNWEPHLSCAQERRVGKFGDGGKWICSPECMLRRCGCRAISIGSNNEFSFESALVGEYGCSVHTFDHTVNGSTAPHGVTFHRKGLGVTQRRVADLAPLRDLFATAGFEWVEVLKVDVDGAEFEAFADADNLDFMAQRAAQLLLEVHWDPQGEDAQRLANLARSLTDAGFYAFHKEPNIQNEWNGHIAVEYSFLNRRRSVWWTGCRF